MLRTIIIGDALFENVYIAQTYKGDFHILCEVEGKECKFVITQNKEEYPLIEQAGPSNLTKGQLCAC